MIDANRYYVERRKSDSLRGEKVSDLNWDSLVKLASKHGILAVDKIRFHNKGQRGGTEQIEGWRMLELWKEVRRQTKSN